MENKKVTILIMLVALLLLAGIGAYFFGLKQGKGQIPTTDAKTHTAVTCMQDFGLEKAKTDASVITNPMQNLPESNPFEKIKTNPFE
ncbi:MAG: hypothetical protein V1845_02470 [bacterium]